MKRALFRSPFLAFSTKDNASEEAEGKAYLVGERDVGHLKVSFFGPFHSSYVVFELDKEYYPYAFISGNNRDYLWFLSRKPTVGKDPMDHFLQRAGTLGFDTDALIVVEQN